MPEMEGVDVAIEVDGWSLEEHREHRDDKTKTITCHVASVAGKKFGVKIECASVYVDETAGITSRVRIHLDGVRVESRTLGSAHEDGNFIKRSTTITGARCGLSQLKEFAFSRIELREESEDVELPVGEIGAITITVDFVRLLRPTNEKESDPSKIPLKLLERQKLEGGDHCSALLSEPADINVAKYSRVKRCSRLPTYTFIFRHASRDWLRAKGIIAPDRRPLFIASPTPESRQGTIEPSRPKRPRRTAEIQEDPNRHLLYGSGVELDLFSGEERERYKRLLDSYNELKAMEEQAEERKRIVKRVKLEVKNEDMPIRVHGTVIDLTLDD